MNKYKLVLVLKSSLNEAARKKVADNVKDIIKDAKFEKDEDMGEKELAYPIKKELKGFYKALNFELTGQSLSDLEKKLNNNEDILRYLLLKK